MREDDGVMSLKDCTRNCTERVYHVPDIYGYIALIKSSSND